MARSTTVRAHQRVTKHGKPISIRAHSRRVSSPAWVQQTGPQSRALTMADVVRLNQERGGQFFDLKTMRFWKSRIETPLRSTLLGPNADRFITSEKAPGEPRRYKIRKFNRRTGSVTTISKPGSQLAFKTGEDARGFEAFHSFGYPTLKKAIKAAREQPSITP